MHDDRRPSALVRAAMTGLLALACALAPMAQAAEVVGRVLLARGTVTATGDDGAVRALRRRSEVREADVLETGADGVLQVRFDDGATLELRAATRVALSEYRYERPAEGADSVLMEIFTGALRAISGAVGGDAYELRTPVASIGIRGTHYETAQESADAWVYGVWDGGIAVANAHGSLDLGADAEFLFARARTGEAPVGLLEPPAALAAPTAGEEDDGAAGTGAGFGFGGAFAPEAAPAPASAATAPVANGASVAQPTGEFADAAVNPAEGVGSAEELAALRDAVVGGFELTERERVALASRDARGILLLADGRVITAAATVGDDGGPLFLVDLEAGEQALIRGGSAEIRDPAQSVAGFDVSWGAFAAADPAVFIGSGQRVTEGVLTGDLGFLLVDAAQLADLTVNAAYAGDQAFGVTSAGEITDFGVFFDAILDLGDGRIEDGHLLLEAGGGAEEYRVNFDGRVLGGEAELGVTQGTISGTAIDGTLDVDTDLSVLRGLFTADGEGFAGGFNLQEAGNDARFARGGFVAEKAGVTGTSDDG